MSGGKYGFAIYEVRWPVWNFEESEAIRWTRRGYGVRCYMYRGVYYPRLSHQRD